MVSTQRLLHCNWHCSLEEAVCQGRMLGLLVRDVDSGEQTLLEAPLWPGSGALQCEWLWRKKPAAWWLCKNVGCAGALFSVLCLFSVWSSDAGVC